jgi:BirA family biotin operon repressor/biotin-[acetyl-CoA-carboxylase] ligase
VKTKILNLLRETKDYVSGQEISKKLNISRTAVWKNIQTLQNSGYQIEAVRNKGYHLIDAPLDDVTQMEIAHALHTEWIGKELYCHDTIDSTNVEVKRLAEKGLPEGTLVIADCQEVGKGRRGRSWSSPSGSGLWMSTLLRPVFEPQKASMITILVAMAVMEGIRECTGLQTQIKWPNDVVYKGRKICGILTEMTLEENRINYVIPGVGINVNTENFPEDLQEKAISLKMILQKTVKRAVLANAVWTSFEKLYREFLAQEDLSFIQEEYNRYLVNREQPIYLMERNAPRQVTQLGLSADGGLEVVNDKNEKEVVYSGEISIRGVYGYVD